MAWRTVRNPSTKRVLLIYIKAIITTKAGWRKMKDEKAQTEKKKGTKGGRNGILDVAVTIWRLTLATPLHIQ